MCRYISSYVVIDADILLGEAGRWLRLQPPIPHPLDQQVVEWMRSKVDNCLEHRHSIVWPSFCPDRLLDVSRVPARLVLKEEVMNPEAESGSLATRPRYAALTYCWGTGE